MQRQNKTIRLDREHRVGEKAFVLWGEEERRDADAMLRALSTKRYPFDSNAYEKENSWIVFLVVVVDARKWQMAMGNEITKGMANSSIAGIKKGIPSWGTCLQPLLSTLCWIG